jgi:hypothetical protein
VESNNCVACGARYVGNDHHCNEEWENRSESARNADRDESRDRRGYGSRLAEGFGRMGYDDGNDEGWWFGL